MKHLDPTLTAQLQAEVLGSSVGLRDPKGQVEILIRLEERVAVLEKPGNWW